MSDTNQSYKNHGRIVPLYHYVLFGILLVNFLGLAYHAVGDPDLVHLWSVVMAAALILIALFARTFALKAQDRVIRLEERLRLRELLPAELKARIPELSADQLIALRFASDAEVPELTATVLRDNIRTRDGVKKLIRDWRIDDHRL
ncbi:MAG: DUF6526 family protein [Vicinamibacterales bacterium]